MRIPNLDFIMKLLVKVLWLFGESITDEIFFYEERVTWRAIIVDILVALLILFLTIKMGVPYLNSFFSGNLLKDLFWGIIIIVTGNFIILLIPIYIVYSLLKMAYYYFQVMSYGNGLIIKLDEHGMTYYEDKKSHFKSWSEITDISYKNYPKDSSKINYEFRVNFSDETFHKLESSNPKEFQLKFEHFWYTFFR